MKNLMIKLFSSLLLSCGLLLNSSCVSVPFSSKKVRPKSTDARVMLTLDPIVYH